MKKILATAMIATQLLAPTLAFAEVAELEPEEKAVQMESTTVLGESESSANISTETINTEMQSSSFSDFLQESEEKTLGRELTAEEKELVGAQANSIGVAAAAVITAKEKGLCNFTVDGIGSGAKCVLDLLNKEEDMSPTQRKILEEAAQGNIDAIAMLGLSDEEIMDAVASPEERSKLGELDELGVGAMALAGVGAIATAEVYPMMAESASLYNLAEYGNYIRPMIQSEAQWAATMSKTVETVAENMPHNFNTLQEGMKAVEPFGKQAVREVARDVEVWGYPVRDAVWEAVDRVQRDLEGSWSFIETETKELAQTAAMNKEVIIGAMAVGITGTALIGGALWSGASAFNRKQEEGDAFEENEMNRIRAEDRPLD